MDKGKRKIGEQEDEGVQKQPRLGSEQETSSPEVSYVSPPMRKDDYYGRYVYKIGENLTERYQIKSKLGKGSSGEVLECWDREKGESVAIKVSRSTRNPNVANNERYILQKLAERPGYSPRFVQMRDSFVYRNHDCIVFEKLGPSLRQFLQMTKCSPVPLELVWQFGRRLLEAVALLHEANVIHADLKPENILLASRNYEELLARERSSVRCSYWPQSSAIKVIDFGSSFILEPHQIQVDLQTNIVTTRYYRAPEIILGFDLTYPADLWSVGCILAELCTGQVLFQVHHEYDYEHIAAMGRVLGSYPMDMLQNARNASKCPQEDHGARLKLNCPQGVSSEDISSRIKNHQPLQELVSRHVKSSELIDLLHALLKYDPLERLTARQAMDHPFFTKHDRWEIDQEGNVTITLTKGK